MSNRRNRERILRDIMINQSSLRTIYNPATAFGNKEVIERVRHIEELAGMLEGDDCYDCDGTGYIDHDCDCPHCQGEIECEECNGTGVIEKETTYV